VILWRNRPKKNEWNLSHVGFFYAVRIFLVEVPAPTGNVSECFRFWRSIAGIT
jgi:hypothetical protein